MNLNSLLADDDELLDEVEHTEPNHGLESTMTEYVQIAEAMSNDPKEDLDLQETIIGFEQAMYDMDRMSELSHGVSSSKSISRRIAAEARSIYNPFDGDTTLKFYTEAATGTRLREATESFSKALVAMIAGAAALIVLIIWKALNWIYGGKRDDKPPSEIKAKDIAKVITDGPKAQEEAKVDKAMAKAAVEVAEDMVDASKDGEELIKKSTLGWYVKVGDNRIEIHSTSDYFMAFELFLKAYGKAPEEFLMASALAKSLQHKSDYHVAIGQLARQLTDISYRLLLDAKANRRSIADMMADSDTMEGMSKDVASTLKSELANKPHTPELGDMKHTSINSYTVTLMNKRVPVADALNTLTNLRVEAMSKENVKIESIEQIQHVIKAATASEPLGYANNLFEQRDALIKTLIEAASITEDLQALTDQSFNPSHTKCTITDTTRALVKPELARVQAITRAVTDVAMLIQRELEDWRRDLWKAVSMCERYGSFLGRIKPVEGEDGKYDQEAILEWGRIQEKFSESTIKHMAEVNALLSAKRHKAYGRVAKYLANALDL